ncbi:PREDICTED: uncharacterized protein LOC108567847 [Nicrophorus vespilloides]|uniref:Uncharacterized protein LOC108567847 n=1 Tax=Nicrophorus vespilloides TaxID=110193 RepID=A0ABM1NB36_NICVS|nr:PREDICTED: uncharacterized protein LOC108567847 [Nicrophorus vespilloides]
MMMNLDEQIGFSAETFVNRLLKEGQEVRCDDSNQNFHENLRVPYFYDEAKFKRGQQFYRRNVFVMFYGKLMGLIAILAVPSILHVLKYTKMSNEPKTAYRRYLATLFHMIIWYNEDFNPASDLWKSLVEVRGKHNMNSKKSCKAGLNYISQKDMALTQFGFMGFVIARSREIGIFDATKEELESFIHLWKVIGYMMGIEDRFNICRDDPEDTKRICCLLIDKVFKLKVEEQQSDFLQMSTALVNGMWAMNPMLIPEVIMIRLIRLLNAPEDFAKHTLISRLSEKLNKKQKFLLDLMEYTISTYKYTALKFYHNVVMNASFWLMKNFPFLAFYSFGYANSYVKVLNTRPTQSG